MSNDKSDEVKVDDNDIIVIKIIQSSLGRELVVAQIRNCSIFCYALLFEGKIISRRMVPYTRVDIEAYIQRLPTA